jgi:hypothetical protein
MCCLKPRQIIHFCIFIFSVFQFRNQLFSQLNSGTNGPHEMQALSTRGPRVAEPYYAELTVFFVVDKYCVLCKVQNELSLSEEGNIQEGICEDLNTCNCKFLSKVRNRVHHGQHVSV